MSKLLKNTTGSDILISEVGITIPANSTYTSQPTDALLWAGSNELVTHLGTGDLIGNDGTKDLTKEETVKLFQGLYPSTVVIEGASFTNGNMNVAANVNVTTIPTIVQNTFRVDWSKTKVDLNKHSNGYTSIYSYSGSGKLYSFKFQFNSKDVEIRLTIDEIAIFEIPCDLLEELFHNDDMMSSLSFLKWDKAKDTITFEPKDPMSFGTSILVEARADSNSNSKDMKRYMVNIDKES